MKHKFGKLLIIITAAMSFCVGCNGKEVKEMDKIVPANKILVVYFSHSGNTREMARQIQKATGGDIFEIIPVEPYPTEYQRVVDQAKKEIRAGFQPKLKNKVTDISKYDLIFVGSPNWWSTIAPPVATFLTIYDLSGKTIVPFVTHGGGGMAHCDTDLFKLCPKSIQVKGLAVSGSSVGRAQDEVYGWLKSIHAIK